MRQPITISILKSQTILKNVRLDKCADPLLPNQYYERNYSAIALGRLIEGQARVEHIRSNKCSHA